MRISVDLAHKINNLLQEATGAADLALITEDAKKKAIRIRQMKDAIRRVAETVAANTDHLSGASHED